VVTRRPGLALRQSRPPVPQSTFEGWWDPLTLGVGPGGTCIAGLDDERRVALRAHCTELLPPAPFENTGVAPALQVSDRNRG